MYWNLLFAAAHFTVKTDQCFIFHQGSLRKEFPVNIGGSDVCFFCRKRVYVMERLSAEGKFFHRSCFKCDYCGTTLRLSSYAFDVEDGKSNFFSLHSVPLWQWVQPGDTGMDKLKHSMCTLVNFSRLVSFLRMKLWHILGIWLLNKQCINVLNLDSYLSMRSLSLGKFYCKPHYCYRLSGYAQRKRPAPSPAAVTTKVPVLVYLLKSWWKSVLAGKKGRN